MKKVTSDTSSKKQKKKVRFAGDVKINDINIPSSETNEGNPSSTDVRSGMLNCSSSTRNTSQTPGRSMTSFVPTQNENSVQCLIERLMRYMPDLHNAVQRNVQAAHENKNEDALFTLLDGKKNMKDNNEKSKRKTIPPVKKFSNTIKKPQKLSVTQRRVTKIQNKTKRRRKNNQGDKKSIHKGKGIVSFQRRIAARRDIKIPSLKQPPNGNRNEKGLENEKIESINYTAKFSSNEKEHFSAEPKINASRACGRTIPASIAFENRTATKPNSAKMPSPKSIEALHVVQRDFKAFPTSSSRSGNAGNDFLVTGNNLKLSSAQSYASKFRNRMPGIGSNLYLLLSKHGCETRAAEMLSYDRKTWSSHPYWYFCGIMLNGFPWKLYSHEQLKKVAKELLRREDIEVEEMEIRQKLLDVHMIRDLNKFHSEEWEAYNTHRFHTLSFLGAFALEKRVNRSRGTEPGIELNPSQGLVWENNSCAYDAFLSILPHIATSLIQEKVYERKVWGSNGLYHAPVAMITCAFDLLEKESGILPRVASNWVRHLAIDIIRYEKPDFYLSKNIALWSTFSSMNTFCDIGTLYSDLDIFFGSQCEYLTSVGPPIVKEIATYALREQALKACQDGARLKSLADILFKAMIADLNSHRGKCNLETGIYVFSTSFVTNNRDTRLEKWFPSSFQTDWSGSFVLSDDCLRTTPTRKWFLKLIALTSSATLDSEHFVSARCECTARQCFLYHDSLQANGAVQKLDVHEVIPHKMQVNQAFLVTLLKPAE